MTSKIFAASALAAGLLLGAAAMAAEPAAPTLQHMAPIDGVIQGGADGQFSVKTAEGKSVTFRVGPSTHLMTAQPVNLDAIQAGTYVGTANIEHGDGTGVSTEVHLAPRAPGAAPGAGGVNMPWAGGGMMTNGSVAKVVETPEGKQIQINYGAGVRTVLVPKKTPIVNLTPSTDFSLLKAGGVIKLVGAALPDGVISAAYVTIQIPPAK
jgi:hypothetical protein